MINANEARQIANDLNGNLLKEFEEETIKEIEKRISAAALAGKYHCIYDCSRGNNFYLEDIKEHFKFLGYKILYKNDKFYIDWTEEV